ncbi:hypothetical protein AB0939_06560 [Streptomyces sp. NPDC006990]|uniref:hypothetical protein n=1 Tax=Streptomyces sp. NPDC006990 TaxID=3154481 RepID=UPI0034539DB4
MSADSQSSTRHDVEFDADGTTLRGWFYPAPDSAPTSAVVMVHGFSLVKEAYLTATPSGSSPPGLRLAARGLRLAACGLRLAATSPLT